MIGAKNYAVIWEVADNKLSEKNIWIAYSLSPTDEHFLFYSLDRKDIEIFNHYVAMCRKISEKCNFGNQLDWDWLVIGRGMKKNV